MVNALVTELAPIRVNALHPGIIGDSPYWAAKPAEVLEGYRSRTPDRPAGVDGRHRRRGRLPAHNRGVNGVQLYVDNGWLLM